MPKIQPYELKKAVTAYTKPVETTLRSDQSVGEAMASLRQRKIKSKVIYFYVIDISGALQGVVSTRALLLSEPNTPIKQIMDHPVISVPSNASLELAMEMFAMHRLLALPVVDEQQKLLGTLDVQLYADEIFDMAETSRMADIFQLIGLSVQQMRESNAWRSFASRMPWLSCNLVGGIVCAIIGAYFELVLEQVLMLAMFVPLVLTLAESISVQAVTLGLQQLHSPGVQWSNVLLRLLREWKTALLLGLASGFVVGVSALFWGQGINAPAVIGLSITITMVLAATLGTLLPAVLHAVKLDPKVAAGPVVLMFTDIITLTCYLGLATWWLL